MTCSGGGLGTWNRNNMGHQKPWEHDVAVSTAASPALLLSALAG